jgi:hypothetical protein
MQMEGLLLREQQLSLMPWLLGSSKELLVNPIEKFSIGISRWESCPLKGMEFL